MLRATVRAREASRFDAVSEFPRITVYVIEDNIPHHNQARNIK